MHCPAFSLTACYMYGYWDEGITSLLGICGNVVLCKQPKWWVRKANGIIWLAQSNELHTSWPARRRGSESGLTDHTKSFTNQIKWKGGSLLFMVLVNIVGWYKRCQNVEIIKILQTCIQMRFACTQNKTNNLVFFHHTRITQSDRRISKSQKACLGHICNSQSETVNSHMV